jgi:UDP-N-acetylglucosamine--N-acetylmuramyl-(pentapeptide) pyrophosphoryl-undecaprenol N-acetylglucosamine transferase
MRILFAAGGTGGHLKPAINLAETLRGRDPGGEIFFVTSGRGIEKEFFGGDISGSVSLFPGTGSRPPLSSPLPWLHAVKRARRVIREFKPQAVVATGGYVTMPVVAALAVSGIPLYLLEQNAVPGRATRMAARRAHRVFCHYESAAAKLRRRAVAPGSPLAESLLEGDESVEEARSFFELEPGLKTLLVAGGSLGARRLNTIVLENLDAMQEGNQILHITGEKDFEAVRVRYREAGIPARVLSFCSRMDRAYRAADLILCRAGGMTVAETCACGLPAVLVPYPYHKDRHQYLNAGLLVRAGAGLILGEEEASRDGFRLQVVPLLNDSGRLLAMAAASRSLAKPHAAADIIAAIREDLEGRSALEAGAEE